MLDTQQILDAILQHTPNFEFSTRLSDWHTFITQTEQQQVDQTLSLKHAGTTERAAAGGVKSRHLVLSSVFCHLPVALVLGQQHGLLLLVVTACAGLAGSQGMQAQLGQTAHEHMQLAPNPLLRLQQCSAGSAHMSAEQAGHWQACKSHGMSLCLVMHELQ